MKKRFAAFFLILVIVALCMTACESDSEESASATENTPKVCSKLVFKAEAEETSDKELNDAKKVLEKRLSELVSSDVQAEVMADEQTIVLRYPKQETELSTDQLAELTQPNVLTFRPDKWYAETLVDANGKYIYKTPTYPNSDYENDERTDEQKQEDALKYATQDTTIVLMDYSMVEKAETVIPGSSLNDGSAEYSVMLTFTEEGKERFAQITRTYLNQAVSIWMDDIMIAAPTIMNEITDGKAIVSGGFSKEDAEKLANQINGDPLTCKLALTEVTQETIGGSEQSEQPFSVQSVFGN